MTLTARLYGSSLSFSSHTVVTSAFMKELTARGLLAGFYSIDGQGLEEMQSTEGADAYHGIYTGPLDQIEVMLRAGNHQKYWVMVAPNSDRLPRQLIKHLDVLRRTYAGKFALMAPSRWACDVVEEQVGGFCAHVPHGVDPVPLDPAADTSLRRAREKGRFRFLHFSTCAQQRKGTRELILAWILAEKAWAKFALNQLGQPLQLELCLVLDRPAEMAIKNWLMDEEIALPPTVFFVPRAAPPENAELPLTARLQYAHCIVQPSRGEAFGLVPLEALSVGVPVVATTCTGHSNYLGRHWPRTGYVEIPTGESAPLDDVEGSQAPSLDPGDIATALTEALGDWPQLKTEAIENAPKIQELFSWATALEDFMNRIEQGG